MQFETGKNKSDSLDRSIYKYILRHTLWNQVLLVALTFACMPVVYFTLEIPKLIINDAIGGSASDFVVLGIQITQTQYLLALSFLFLLLVILSGMFKYFLNVYRGALGERMLRRLRYTLYCRILRFPLHHFTEVSSGELIPMVTAETEPLGGFIGDAIALPVFQGGLLITYIYFIFAQNIYLGIAAIALFPLQVVLIPKLQRRINSLGRKRIRTVRKLADRIDESVNAIAEIHINDTGHRERADISHRLGQIFNIRYEIFRRKFFIKFLNNFLAQTTPFFFFSIGGYLVLTDRLSLGALVAVLAAYKDITPPWKELLKFYQISEDARVKYDQLIQQFELEHMIDRQLHEELPDSLPRFTESFTGTNISLSNGHEAVETERYNFDIRVQQSVAIHTDDENVGKKLALLMSGLEPPTSGSIQADKIELSSLYESQRGRSIGYCSPESYVFDASVWNNLCYGLQHRPVGPSETTSLPPEELKESKASGNSTENIESEWTDYSLSGACDTIEFKSIANNIIRSVQLDAEILGLAFHSYLVAEQHQSLMLAVIEARQHIKAAMEELDDGSVVENFDRDTYSQNLTVAGNLLFGTPLVPGATPHDVTKFPEVWEIMDSSGLKSEFLEMGFQLSQIMLELFAGVDEHSELFEQYSFIKAQDFDSYKALVDKLKASGLEESSEDERMMLISLTLQLCPNRHRLGLITADIQEKILAAREKIFDLLGWNNESIQFIDREHYQIGMTVQENLLFGKISYYKRHLLPKINKKLISVLTERGIADSLIELGLDYNCGHAGSHLSNNFRRKLCLARQLIKNPDILIVDNILSSIDAKTQGEIMSDVLKQRAGQNLIWITDDTKLARLFDRTLTPIDGTLVDEPVELQV